MNNTLKKFGLIITSIFIITAMSLFLSSYFSVSAANGTSTENKNCTIEMRPFIKEQSKEFRDYLTKHFQNKSNNSSLLPLAMLKFDKYKQDLKAKLKTYYPETGKELQSESTDLINCTKQMNDEIALMEQLFKKFFLETANIKTTSTLMNKLKEINAKLDTLNGRVTIMLGRWETASERISCLIKTCLGG